jgi:hypothetical protein
MRSDSATHLAALTTTASPPLRAWLHRRADPVGAVLDRILTMRGRDRGAFIPGARKYAGQMKAILNAAGLAGLEAQGPGFAYDAVTRDKLWPRYDGEEQREAGDSAGAAYLKTKIRSYIVARPDDTPAARAAYRAEIARLRDYLDVARTLADVRKVCIEHYQYPSRADRVIEFQPPGAYTAAARLYFMGPEETRSAGEKAAARDYELRRDYARVTHGPTTEATMETLYGDRYTIVVYQDTGLRSEAHVAAIKALTILGPRAKSFLSGSISDAQAVDLRTAATYEIGNNWTWAASKEADTTAQVARETLLPPTDAQTLRDAGWSAGGAYLIHKLSARFPATVAAASVADMQPALDLFRGIVTGEPTPDALTLVNTLWATFSRPHQVFFGIATSEQRRDAREAGQHGQNPREFYSELFGAAVGAIAEAWGKQTVIFGQERPNPEEAALFTTAIAALPNDFRIGVVAIVPAGNRWLNPLFQDAFRFDGRGEAGWTWAATPTTPPKARGERFKFERPAVVDTVRKGGRPIPPVITSERVERDFALQGTQYGKWMNDNESDRIEASMYGSLLDLADVLGVPDRAVSFGGRLAFSFGARGSGNFAAHYEPLRKVINMTRTQGAGAVAHEWGHAFDHWLGDDGKQGRDAYVSVRGQPTVHGGPAVQAAIDALLDAMHGADVKTLEKQRDKAELAWRAAWRAAPSSIDAASSPVVQAARAHYEALTERWREARRSGGKASNYATNSKKAGDYYARPWEMFARAFEAYAEDTLADAGRLSTYFVNGTRSTALASVYPAGDERTAINAAFRALLNAVRASLAATARG